ncbi:hypothetical protein [Lysinibacillus sp. FSL W8-0953]|jgi:hypothetical protein|uniref:hypothetical protein n=1 Tax=Lysinibacillus sp. FSL W8-0953 TaxID=2954640 RepID=UPI0030F66C93
MDWRLVDLFQKTKNAPHAKVRLFMMTRSIVIFVQAVMSGLRRHVKIRIAPTASNDQTPHCQTIAKFFYFHV